MLSACMVVFFASQFASLNLLWRIIKIISNDISNRRMGWGALEGNLDIVRVVCCGPYFVACRKGDWMGFFKRGTGKKEEIKRILLLKEENRKKKKRLKKPKMRGKKKEAID